MTLYILTLHWNRCDSLVRLKDTLLSSLTNIPFKWWIKDNGSTDNSYETASKWNNDDIIFHQYANNNQSFSQGMNYLFNLAKPSDNDLIFFLNNDVQFADTTSIQKMINIIELDKSIGMVGATLLYTGSNKIQHCGVVFTDNRMLPSAPPVPIHLYRGQEANEHTNKNRTFQACTAAVLLMRASDFAKVGCFDENYKWMYEDIDLCLSVSLGLKKKVVMCGEANIYHDESASLKLNPVNKLYLSHNITTFTNKWRNNIEVDVRKYLKDPNYGLYHGPK